MRREGLPPLTTETIASLWNGGFCSVVDRLLAQALPVERAALRADALRRGAALARGWSPARLRDRMLALAQALPAYLDQGTIDGCLALAIIAGRGVPSVWTVARGIEVTE